MEQSPSKNNQDQPAQPAQVNQVSKMKKNLIGIAVIVGIVLVFYFVNMIVFRLLRLFIGTYLALLAIVSVYYYGVRLGIIAIVFPGSLTFFRRQVEFSAGKNYADHICGITNRFNQIVSYFLDSASLPAVAEESEGAENFEFYCDQERARQFVLDCSKIKGQVKAYSQFIDRMYQLMGPQERIKRPDQASDEEQEEPPKHDPRSMYEVTPDQRELFEALKTVKVRMQNTSVTFNEERKTLWKLADLSYPYTANMSFLMSRSDFQSKLGKLQSAVQRVEDLVSVYNSDSKGAIDHFKKILNCKSLGTLNQMFVGLETQRGCVTDFLETGDWFGSRIQVFFISASNQLEKLHGIRFHSPFTMILCNPNMGYGENTLHSEILDFYLENGINVVLWNYRGFGNSEGFISTQACRSDIEKVFLWAKMQTQKLTNNQVQVKIGVHGTSIGGLTATHLGRIGAVDFIFVDRSLMNLQSMATGFFKGAPFLLRLFTMWDMPDCADDYLYSNCYKVIGQDPNDEVIPDQCSLKTGVAQAIIENELYNHELSLSLTTSRVLSINQYFHIINQHETELLFEALDHIFSEIFEFSIQDQNVRYRFSKVSNTEHRASPGKMNIDGGETLRGGPPKDAEDSYQLTTRRALQRRMKKNEKYEDQYKQSFHDSSTSLTKYMMTTSVLEPSPDGRHAPLPTESTYDQDYDANHNSASKSNIGLLDNTFDVADSSMIMAEESLFDDDVSQLTSPGRRSLLNSPGISPRRSRLSMDSARRGNDLNQVKLTNDLGQCRLTSKMRAKENELRTFLSKTRNRPLKQSEKKRMIADFVRYIDSLITFFRLIQKLDAAGDTLTRIFRMSEGERRTKENLAQANASFRNWLINFDIYGSFLPLTSKSWDIQLARSMSYEKLSIFRGSLKDMVKSNEKLNRELGKKTKFSESLILTTLMTKLSLVEFYFAKMESYFRRKHDRILKDAPPTPQVQSEMGSKRNSPIMEAANEDCSVASVAEHPINLEEVKVHDDYSEMTSDDQRETLPDTDLDFYDKISNMKQGGSFHRQSVISSGQVEFYDFLEPHLIKTGYIIPMTGGHNASLNGFEKAYLALHLQSAGFIYDWAGEVDKIRFQEAN